MPRADDKSGRPSESPRGRKQPDSSHGSGSRSLARLVLRGAGLDFRRQRIRSSSSIVRMTTSKMPTSGTMNLTYWSKRTPRESDAGENFSTNPLRMAESVSLVLFSRKLAYVRASCKARPILERGAHTRGTLRFSEAAMARIGSPAQQRPSTSAGDFRSAPDR
jgi:hypothetical protein